MPATDASEMLELFAAGSAPRDVCTREGRAMLRGAVRSYGAEMARAGVAWPAIPAPGDAREVGRVDAAVLSAFAAGFVDASDFSGQARALIGRQVFVAWPAIRGMRQAAHVACEEVAALQQSAARFVLETQLYQSMASYALRSGATERMQQQAERVQRAQAQMLVSAAQVAAAVREARRES
jgi:hypothetical protein